MGISGFPFRAPRQLPQLVLHTEFVPRFNVVFTQLLVSGQHFEGLPPPPINPKASSQRSFFRVLQDPSGKQNAPSQLLPSSHKSGFEEQSTHVSFETTQTAASHIVTLRPTSQAEQVDLQEVTPMVVSDSSQFSASQPHSPVPKQIDPGR